MGTDVVKNVNKNNASHAVLFEALALVSWCIINLAVLIAMDLKLVLFLWLIVDFNYKFVREFKFLSSFSHRFVLKSKTGDRIHHVRNRMHGF